MPKSTKLSGTAILVTRPAHQCEPLCSLIEQAGGVALRFPTIAIDATGDGDVIEQFCHRIGDYQTVIFVSPNAVEYGLRAMLSHAPWPETTAIAAIGRGTGSKVEQVLGRPPDILPSGRFDSESLLQHERLQDLTGRTLAIVRGVGGREHLAQVLTSRGGQVDYLEVYRRQLPDPPPPWPGQPHYTIATSSAGLENLLRLIPPDQREQLLNTPLVVVSKRTAALAQRLGFRQAVSVAANASDRALLECVCGLLPN